MDMMILLLTLELGPLPISRIRYLDSIKVRKLIVPLSIVYHYLSQSPGLSKLEPVTSTKFIFRSVKKNSHLRVNFR